jgi:hypothetical protein
MERRSRKVGNKLDGEYQSRSGAFLLYFFAHFSVGAVWVVAVGKQVNTTSMVSLCANCPLMQQIGRRIRTWIGRAIRGNGKRETWDQTVRSLQAKIETRSKMNDWRACGRGKWRQFHKGQKIFTFKLV